MNDNQLMSMIVDRLDRIERKLDNLPQCHYPEVKEQLARGRDRFDKLETKIEAKLDRTAFAWVVGLFPLILGVLLNLKKFVLGE